MLNVPDPRYNDLSHMCMTFMKCRTLATNDRLNSVLQLVATADRAGRDRHRRPTHYPYDRRIDCPLSHMLDCPPRQRCEPRKGRSIVPSSDMAPTYHQHIALAGSAWRTFPIGTISSHATVRQRTACDSERVRETHPRSPTSD